MNFQNSKVLKLSVLAIAFIAVVILITCDKPFEPVESEDYPFYFVDIGSDQIFVFQPTSKKLDSLKIPWFTSNAAITVSADGKLIYVALGSKVLVVQTDSLTTINELVYQHTQPVAVSPDNKLVAILGAELNILRTSDYSVLYSDTTEYFYEEGNFSSDSKTFYCESRRHIDSNDVVQKVDLSDSSFTVTRKGFPYGSVTEVIPSIDETKWFLYLAVGLWTYSFEVYDVALDSVIFRDVLVPGAGSLAISPDGKNVFYTSPGRTSTDPPPDPTFKIYNVQMNQVVEVVRDSSFFCAEQGCFPPNQLAVTPDGDWLGMIGGQAIFTPEFYVYDIKKRKMAFRLGMDTGPRLFFNITSQNSK